MLSLGKNASTNGSSPMQVALAHLYSYGLDAAFAADGLYQAVVVTGHRLRSATFRAPKSGAQRKVARTSYRNAIAKVLGHEWTCNFSTRAKLPSKAIIPEFSTDQSTDRELRSLFDPKIGVFS